MASVSAPVSVPAGVLSAPSIVRPAKAATVTTTPAPEYNTKNLGMRLAADAVSGYTAASVVAPFIAIIDRSIMENASGANTLGGSLRASFATLLTRPQQILLGKPFALICLLYGSTYFTANAVDTATSTARNLPASHVTAGTAKFAASSAANVGICMYKDRVFARMFGPPGVVPRAVPMPSYALFAARDCLTIFASFIVPPRLGPVLDRMPGLQNALGASSLLSGHTVAQFVAPALMQFAGTPAHLLGLDLYNRPWRHEAAAAGASSTAASWGDRFAAVRKNWMVSSLARIARIVPAFGVGGVTNMKMRKAFMTRLE